MIKSFRSKALKLLWEKNDESKLPPDQISKIKRQLNAMEVATDANQLKVPGWGLHPLKGDREGTFALTTKKNWRLTFSMDDQDIIDVDFEDYH